MKIFSGAALDESEEETKKIRIHRGKRKQRRKRLKTVSLNEIKSIKSISSYHFKPNKPSTRQFPMQEFKCTNQGCMRSFISSNNLKRHMLYACSGERRFKCGHCNYQGFYHSSVRRHSNNIHKKLPVICIDLKKKP